jgi:hypothetical protein
MGRNGCLDVPNNLMQQTVQMADVCSSSLSSTQFKLSAASAVGRETDLVTQVFSFVFIRVHPWLNK